MALYSSVYTQLCKLYEIYNNDLKPLISSIESITGQFPGMILNEIRAYNDHVARCFRQGISEQEALSELKKCKSHLVRAILDCYKILLNHYYEDVRTFYEQYKDVNLVLVNDGKFLPKLIQLKNTAEEKSISARLEEANAFPEKEKSYSAYMDAVLAYKDVEKHILDHEHGLSLVTQFATDNSEKEDKRDWKFALISAGIGAVLGAILGALITFFTTK